MNEHTKGLLRVGHSGAVVADHPVPEMSGSDAVEYYGGHLVAESVTAANARRLAACWNLLDGYDTKELEGVSLAEFVAKQAYLKEMNTHDGLNISMSGIALQMVAASFAGQFKANSATNYLELSGSHPETGPFTITMQRTHGLTPAQKLAAMTKQRDVLLDALNGVLGVMNNSQGVAGWHQNGAIATWDELLPEVAAALEFVEGEQS
ncbi:MULTISPECIES: hypothetical protein [Aeromonas]|uniref:hypothetical protein n=1 Tax=Aeromonas TaxID=642 RepID=UPI0015DC2856|nr:MULTISPECIES: hypothetical protein [Aeromonas]WEA31663.1 hypothetical protein PWO56_07615 [Aeromonas hydrophila]WEA32179.1 hypothetical protein PWO56_10325 [Aeromonas hydrophila]BBS17715.1 hypothetical protein WP5W18E02_27520 [Aeromonas caviae]